MAVHDGGGGEVDVRVASPSTTADLEETTTTTTSVVTTTTSTPPTTKAAAAPAPRKPAASTKKPPASTYGPRGPGTVAFAPDPNRTSWSATSNGITMTATIDRQHVPVGQPMTFTVTASSATESCCGALVLFGDGSKFDRQPTEPCGGGQGSPGTKTWTTTHPFNREGRWEVNFQAYTGNCNTPYHSYGGIYFWVYAAPGTPAAQGPALPTIQGGWMYPPSGEGSTGLTAKVGGHGHDDDGFVHHFSIDWGDGARSEAPGDPNGCRPTPGGWPATSDAWYPRVSDPPTPPPSHTYAKHGDYKVVVTVHSIGCDGTMEQTARWTDTWHTAGPNP